MGKKRNKYVFLDNKHKRKRLLRILRERREDNIKMYLKEISCEDSSGSC